MERESRLFWEAPPAPAPRVAAAPRFRLLHGILLAATLLSTTVAGALQAGVDPFADPAGLTRGLPFSLTLMCIVLVHEAGHYLMCLRYGVTASLPYVLPGPPLPPLPGTFGAFIRIQSPFPDRRALFDVGAAGPWAGFVVALIAMIVGLSRSTVLPTAPDGGLVVLGDSFVMSALIRVVLHADPATVVLGPVAYAGWFGFLITALNLLPVGQLDGGHAVYAVARRWHRTLSYATIAGFVAFSAYQSIFLHALPQYTLWIVILWILRDRHPTLVDESSELGVARTCIALLLLGIFIVAFVPRLFDL